jgi:hypothetical protein
MTAKCMLSGRRAQLNPELEASEQDFRALFGIGPDVCGHIWNHISRYGWKPPKMRPKYLLWALLFLKVYGTETALSVIAKTSRKTFRKWVWLLLPMIAGMEPYVVRNQEQRSSTSFHAHHLSLLIDSLEQSTPV